MCKVSDCCGAYSEYAGDIDICPDCLEHCEFADEDECEGGMWARVMGIKE